MLAGGAQCHGQGPWATRSIEGEFLKELLWREFSYHLIHYWPDLAGAGIPPEFNDFPWRSDADSLRAWQQGRTGYPIVDAGMRQLWQTGWMHNRVRMIAASFLVKHLLIPWQEGEAWFWDTLVDADLANNAASWQWVAGCGRRRRALFPHLQSDPAGREVRSRRRLCPPLGAGTREAPGRDDPRPWEAPPNYVSQTRCRPGQDLPTADRRSRRGKGPGDGCLPGDAQRLEPMVKSQKLHKRRTKLRTSRRRLLREIA